MTRKKVTLSKRASKTVRSVAKDTKQVSKTAKAASKTIKQITKAVTKLRGNSPSKSAPKNQPSTKTPPKKAVKKQTPSLPTYPKKLSSKKSYALRELPIAGQPTIKKYMLEIEKHPELDALKQPGEYWSFILNGGKSVQVFDSIELAAGALSRYQLRHSLDKDVEAVKFLKFHKSGSNPSKPLTEKQEETLITTYQGKRKRAKEKRKMEDTKVFEAAAKAVEKKTGTKAHRSADIVRGFMTMNDELTKALSSMQKQMEAMQKEMAKLAKANKQTKGKTSKTKQAASGKTTTKASRNKTATKAKGTKAKGSSKPSKKRNADKGTKKAATKPVLTKKTASKKAPPKKGAKTKGKGRKK